jgi:hypothetical protein
MNRLEDRLTAALRDTGEEISPDSVPPLRLHDGRRRVTLPRLPRRWMTGLTPLAAAAAVAVVVVASLPISAMFHGHIRSTGPVAAPRWNGSPIGPRSALHKAPPYFVELPMDTKPYVPQTATVRSTVTGRVLATVRPPRPYKVFNFVSGAADDRTFVLAAQRWWNVASGEAGARAQNRDNTTHVAFFRLTFAPATRTAQLTRLTVPGKIRATDLAGMGVSPDGTRLALDLRRSIQIIKLATGATRTWTWPRGGWIGNFKPFGQIFSWSADGKTLAFQQWGGYLDSTAHVRLLDTTAPGHSLTAAKVILTFFNKAGVLNIAPFNTLLTADGSKIVVATGFSPRRHPRLGYENITEFSVRTGKPVLSQDKFATLADGEQAVLWASPDGSALVVSDPRGAITHDGPRKNVFGVLAGNKFTPIPHGTHTFDQVAW